MGIFDRLFGRGETAAKALDRPAWWGEVWRSDAADEDGEYGDSPQGRISATESNVWAYNCVKARASAIAQVPMKLYRGYGDEREEIHEHPVLDLLETVNAINLNARSFRREMEIQLSIHGRCVIQKVRGASGVAELFILPLNYLEIVPDPKLWISGFTWIPTNSFIPRADVIDLHYPAFDGGVEADSPIGVALDAINRYNLADKSQASIDRRGGQKGGIVVHPQGTLPTDFDRIRMAWDRWRKNPDNAGRDMHVSAGFDYQADAFSATEMQREERLMRLANEIMAACGVPPAIAGDYSDASKLANASVQQANFWNQFAVDELKFIEEELTYSLLHAEYPDTQDMYFEHDLSGIAALKEDADARVQRAIALNASNLASVNEARAMVGMDMSEDEAADRILMEASQADVVADPAPLMAVIAQFNANAISAEAAATLMRIAAPNLTDAQVSAMLTTVPKPQSVTVESASMMDQQQSDSEYGDPELDAFDAEEYDIEAEVEALLSEDAAKAGNAFDEAKVERVGGKFAPKGTGDAGAQEASKRTRNLSPEAKKRMLSRRVSKAREVEAQMKADIQRLDEAAANADDKLKKRIERLRARLQGRLTDAMTIIESNGTTMPKRKRASVVDKLLGGTEPQQASDATANLPVVKAVDETINDPWEPPADVKRAAALGLELRAKFNRGGTMVGVARARDLSNGKRIPPQTINRMLSYFARHEVDKQADGWGDESNPSPGYIAWLLWGGDAGLRWAKSIEREYPAEVKAFAYVDPVGLVAETIDGEELGVIDALHRGGVHDGIKASVKEPVFAIAGKAYASADVMVRYAD